MDINILKFDSNECFEKESFEVPFEYNGNKYNVIVYIRHIQNTDLESSVLIGRSYDGEYILDGVKLLFSVVIYLEKYSISDKYNKAFKFVTYKKI